jgi:hypothetical protein
MVNLIEEIEQAIAEPYAWPGGYPKYILMADGEAMSVDAAKDNLHLILEAVEGEDRNDSWRAIGVQINWEDSNLICCQSNKRIPSAYGED